MSDYRYMRVIRCKVDMSNAKLYSDVCSKDKKISKAPVHDEIEK